MNSLKLKEDLYWVGIQDPKLRTFDIIMHTEHGTTYNSYVLKGSEKTVLFESAKEKFFDTFLGNVTEITSIESIDYIVINHTEPDHTGSIKKLLEINPKIKLVGSSCAINFMKEICNVDFNSIAVKNGDTLSLGNKTLKFISAPNLHWPDTIYTYIEEDHILVTCDSFGAHYSFDDILSSKIVNKEDYNAALKYYFDMIIGPFKAFALQSIKSIADLSIDMICPGHGPVLDDQPMAVVALYKDWSTEVNPNKNKTVVIPYVSAYGYTKIMAESISDGIQSVGNIDVKLYDVTLSDSKLILDELYWADGILLGTPTMVGDALKPIWDLTTSIFAKTHGRKIASAFGSYGWSGEGVPNIMARLEQLQMKTLGKGLRIKFNPNENQLKECFEFGVLFGYSVLEGKIIEKKESIPKAKEWKCVVCGEIVKGEQPPEACPVCGVGPEQFIPVESEETQYTSKQKESIIIIGNNGAGTAAAEAIRERNKDCNLEIISDENIIGYYRPLLTKGLLSNIEDTKFYIQPFAWYQDNNIKLTLNNKVTQLDVENKKIELSDHTSRTYDKLILATGSSCFIPPIDGVDKTGIFKLRNIQDTYTIQEYGEKSKNVVIIGGGILGLEAAWELKKLNLDITVVELSDTLLSRQLDPTGSAILEKNILDCGIKISKSVGVAGITGEDSVTGVKLANGEIIPADMVIISAGVRPNTQLASDAGLKVGRFIEVNELMQTSNTDIYAAGDVASFENISFGIWEQAINMGKVAGANAVGDPLKYKSITPANSFNSMNMSIYSIGDIGKDDAKIYKTTEILDKDKDLYQKLFFVNNILVGGILIGDTSKTPLLIKGLQNRYTLADMMAALNA